jgi:hypothetical protein
MGHQAVGAVGKINEKNLKIFRENPKVPKKLP